METNPRLNDTQESVKLRVCVARGCENNSVNNTKVQLHSFPASQVGKLWQAALGIEYISMQAAVCSMHFRNEDYFEERYLEGNVEKTRMTLKPDAIPTVFPSDNLKTRTPQQGGFQIKEEDERTEITNPTVPTYNPRVDKSLGLLTQKFVELLKSCPGGVLDIHEAVEKLKISRRRIYDITNVLEGVYLIKKHSKRWIQWTGVPTRLMDEQGICHDNEERKLDEMIEYTKQQIQDMFENILSNKYVYLTYEDIQSIPIFQDQAVFVIKAPRDTMLEVAHPKEAFQMHIVSKSGPVKVLGCADNMDIPKSKSQKSKFDDGDYSNLPLRGFPTTATFSKDNANHNTTSSNLFSSPSEPTQPLIQALNIPTCPKPSVLSLHKDQMNSSSPNLSLSAPIKEEMNTFNITPDEPLIERFAAAHEPDMLSTDVHMTVLS